MPDPVSPDAGEAERPLSQVGVARLLMDIRAEVRAERGTVSTLESVIHAYLTSVGFTTYDRDGVEYWGHPRLGEGRTFTDAVTWWIGTEKAK